MNNINYERIEQVCPVITAFMIGWNDYLPIDADRDRLLESLVPLIVGTRSTPAVEEKRGYMALDWLVRVNTPQLLDLVPALHDHAEALRELDPIVDIASATTSAGACDAACDAAGAVAKPGAWAAATWAATWAGVWATSRAGASDVVCDAAWSAAKAGASATACAGGKPGVAVACDASALNLLREMIAVQPS